MPFSVWQNGCMPTSVRASPFSAGSVSSGIDLRFHRRAVIIFTLLSLMTLAGSTSIRGEMSPFPSYVASEPLLLDWYSLDVSKSELPVEVVKLADERGLIDVSQPVRCSQVDLHWTVSQPHQPGMYVTPGSPSSASDTIWYYAEFEVATPVPHLWWYDADDAFHVWLNGRELCRKPFLNGVATPSFSTLIFPRPGKNAILARIENLSGMRVFFTDLRPVVSPQLLSAKIASVCRALVRPRFLDPLICMLEIPPDHTLSSSDSAHFDAWQQNLPICPLDKLLVAFHQFLLVTPRHLQRIHAGYLRRLIEQTGISSEIDHQLRLLLRQYCSQAKVNAALVRRLFMNKRIPQAVLGTRLLAQYGHLPDDIGDLLLQSLTAAYQQTYSWNFYTEARLFLDTLKSVDELSRQKHLATIDLINNYVASAAQRLEQVCRKFPDCEPAFHLLSLSLLQHVPVSLPRCPEAYRTWREKARMEDEKLYRSLIR